MIANAAESLSPRTYFQLPAMNQKPPNFSSLWPQSGYGARTAWFLKQWGAPLHIHPFSFSDTPKIGIMEFAPNLESGRKYWAYATNGMSETPMPNEVEPRGRECTRLELIAYSQSQANWVINLLLEIARYPFLNRCGLYFGHTIPVAREARALWSGYVLTIPSCEENNFRPLGIDWGISPEWVDFSQVVGLLESEIEFAANGGGFVLADRIQKVREPQSLFLDVTRNSSFA